MDQDVTTRIRNAADALKAAGAHEVYVFGPAASGSLRASSDVDLAVSGLPPERFFEAIGEAADILNGPWTSWTSSKTPPSPVT